MGHTRWRRRLLRSCAGQRLGDGGGSWAGGAALLAFAACGVLQVGWGRRQGIQQHADMQAGDIIACSQRVALVCVKGGGAAGAAGSRPAAAGCCAAEGTAARAAAAAGWPCGAWAWRSGQGTWPPATRRRWGEGPRVGQDVGTGVRATLSVRSSLYPVPPRMAHHESAECRAAPLDLISPPSPLALHGRGLPRPSPSPKSTWTCTIKCQQRPQCLHHLPSPPLRCCYSPPIARQDPPSVPSLRLIA